MNANPTTKTGPDQAGTAGELLRLRHRLLKHILDNQRRRESLRRDAAATSSVPAPLSPAAQTVTPPITTMQGAG